MSKSASKKEAKVEVVFILDRSGSMGGLEEDTIGTTIHNIKEVQKADKSKAPDRTLFVITTDGYENSSVEYSYDMVREMVQRQQEVFDWEFIFLGANIDALKEGGRLGIRASQSESEGLSGIAPEELKTSTTGYMMFLSLIQFVQQGHEIRNQTQQTQDDRS